MSKLISELRNAIACSEGLIAIESAEPGEVIYDVTSYVYGNNKEEEDIEKSIFMAMHDPVNGLCDIDGNPLSFQQEEQDSELADLGIVSQSVQGEDALTAIKFFTEMAKGRLQRRENDEMQPGDNSLQMLVLKYFDRQLMSSGSSASVDPVLLSAIDNFRSIACKVRFCAVVLVQPGVKLPTELAEYCAFVDHKLPSSDERHMIIDDIAQSTSLTISEEAVQKAVDVTSGLSRAATERAVAKSITTYRALNPLYMQKFKGEQLGKNDLKFWTSDMGSFALWPVADNEFSQYPEVLCLGEETHEMNSQVPEDHVRVRVRYVADKIKKEHWLDPMSVSDFEEQFRPERDYFSFKNWIGFEGLKAVFRNSLGQVHADRAFPKGCCLYGIPGGGKSFGTQCTAGEFQLSVVSIETSKLLSKWQGETDKNLDRQLNTIELQGGIFSIDEFQRFIPEKKSGGGDGDNGTGSRIGGKLLTWQQEQNSAFIFACANDVSNIPAEYTRAGRFDYSFISSFPGREAKDAGWDMYMRRHGLEQQDRPEDDNWTIGEIAHCCKLAEQQHDSLVSVRKLVQNVYHGGAKKQQDEMFEWAEEAQCICAETGEKFIHPRKRKRTTTRSASTSKATRAPRRNTRKVD